MTREQLETIARSKAAAVAITAAFASLAGAAGAWTLASKRLEKKYVAIAEQEIAEAKKFYTQLHKKEEFSTPESAAAAAGIVIAPEDETMMTQAVQALTSYQGRSNDEGQDDTVVEVTQNVFTDAIVLDDEDDEEERDESRPFVISHDEFMTAEPGFNQVTLTYFEADDVLSDDKDESIDDVEHTIGEENLLRFGHKSKDNNVVYVRNNHLDLDFEVIRNKGSYSQTVLGFIEHSDRPGLRRFRGDDD